MGLEVIIFNYALLLALTSAATAARASVEEINLNKVKLKADDGDAKAAKLQNMAENAQKYSSSGRELALLCTSAATAMGIRHFAIPFAGAMFPLNAESWLSVTVSSVIITVITVFVFALLGFAVPERVVAARGEKSAEVFCGFNIFFSGVLRPFTACVKALENLVVRLFGIDPKADSDSVSQEDIVNMLDAGAEDGTIDADDIEYIKNVFQLEKLTAADVMTPRSAMELIPSDASDKDVLEIIDESGYSRIPVYTDNVDNITGILFVRDYLFKRTNEDFKMSQAVFEPTFVPETVHLDALFKDMQMDHNHMVIVVDEYGGTAGLVTMEDILEELVGEIWDEQDEEVENFVKTGENTYTVLSATPIDEFFEFFDLPEDEEIQSSTVNGWVTEHSGNIPEEGFSFDYKNLTVTVLKADDLHTEEISVTVNSNEEKNTD